ncbi:MAG: FAD-dependent oxidoreductase [Candidatus Njordarchaeales archaeon]
MLRKSYDYDVLIAGGGFAGSFLAYKLASESFRVALFEYKKNQDFLGNKACGGLSSQKVIDFLKEMDIDVENVVDESFKHITIFDERFNELSRIRLDLVHINREKLGQEILQRLKEVGVGVFTCKKVENLVLENSYVSGFMLSDEKVQRGLVTIDATGFNATLRKRLTGYLPETEISLNDLIVGGVDEIPNTSDFETPTIILSNTLAPGGYCWITPLERKTIIGLGLTPLPDGVSLSDRLVYLRRILRIKQRPARRLYGVLPIRRPLSSSVFNGFMVLGDAASHGNPVFEGGIYGALYVAKVASNVLIETLNSSDNPPSTNDLWEFNIRFMRDRGWMLAMLDALRIFVQKFSPKNLYLFASALPERMSFDLNTILHVSLALLTNILKPRIFWSLVDIARYTAIVQDLYLNYPHNPEKIFEWTNRVNAIFDKIKKKKITI